MRVGVVGLGYVGLPLAVAFAESGADVAGVDSDERRVGELRDGHSGLGHVPGERLAAVAPRLEISAGYAALAGAEAVVIAVPTPLDGDGDPDLGPLSAAAASLGEVLRAGQLVSIESTTYPGCTRGLVAPLLEERSGLRAGEDFHLAFSPERLSVTRPEHTIHTIPKVVGGLTAECRDRAAGLFAQVCETVVPVSSLEAAEATKLLENAFRFVNVSFANEFSLVCDALGVDAGEVIDAADTKPFGFMRFDPGPGAGGHCLPVDSVYLAWRARQAGADPALLEAAIEVDRRMPAACADRVAAALAARAEVEESPAKDALEGAGVLLVGVTYKPGVADLRTSPALALLEILRERGASVAYHDALVAEIPRLELESVPLDQGLSDAEAVVLATPHPDLDLELVATRAPVLVDLRGALRRARQGAVG
jgi:UDP-N-acetyl-D-glucosamine dehydrogenase